MENILLVVPCIQFGGTESVAKRYFDELKRNKKKCFYSFHSFFFKLAENSFLYF